MTSLGLPYGLVDSLAKLVPFELKMTLTKALEQEPLLKERYDKEEDVKTLIDLALQLEGLTRNVGKHPSETDAHQSDAGNGTPSCNFRNACPDLRCTD